MDRVLESTKNADAIRKTCLFYLDYVDIYPSIFNFGVQLFLYTEEHQLGVDSVEYREFSHSIEFERENGYSHHVVGGITLPQGLDVDEFLENSLHTLEERNTIQNALYSEDEGMFTFKG